MSNRIILLIFLFHQSIRSVFKGYIILIINIELFSTDLDDNWRRLLSTDNSYLKCKSCRYTTSLPDLRNKLHGGYIFAAIFT